MKLIRRIAELLVILLLSGFLPLAISPALAQTNGIEMKAYAAYDGYFKYGEWLPVWVELSNQGQDVEADVRIQVNGSQGSTVFSVPVSLPSGSRKRFPVYVLANNFSRELEVRLVSQKQALATQKVTVRPQPNITYLVGIISPERGALSLLTGIQLPDQNRPKAFTDLALTDLPDRSEGMRSFDTLILNSTDTSQLSPDQANALLSWVHLGGRLVLGGGASAAQTFAGLPEELKLVSLQGTLEVESESVASLADFTGAEAIRSQGPYLAAIGQPGKIPAGEGRLLAGTEALPLVFERILGGGRVTFIAFDLSGVPFNGWAGTQKFWETLLGPGSTYPQNMPFDVSLRQMRANQLYYAISNIPALDLPSVQGLTLLLIIYILMVGPVNYLVLRWRNRLHWAWITIPAITILFTAGAFSIGYAMRGTDLVLNQIALVEAKPGGTASVSSFLGLFSPRQQSYEIKVLGEGLVSPMNGYDTNSFGPGEGGITTGGGEMVFVQDQPSRIQGLTVNQFSMQSFMSEDTWQNFGSITGKLEMQSEALVGTVRNDTQVLIKDVVVAFQNRFVRLGDLQPGQEAKVDLGLGNLPTDRFGPPLSYRIFQEDNPNGQPSRETELKTNILNSVFDSGVPWSKLISSSSFGGGGSAQSNNLIVFGWINQAPPEVEVSDNLLSRTTTALVYSGLEYSFVNNGLISMPVGMVSGTVTTMPRDSGTCGPNGTASVNMGIGEAEFEFQVPSEVMEAQVRTLKLNLWRDSGGEFSFPAVTVWDWEANNWTTIQAPIQGINVIQNAMTYVSSLGQVRVRLNSDSNVYSCYYIDLGLEAEQTADSGGLQ